MDVFLGHGKFVGENKIEVNGTVLQFVRAVIATGARPWAPPIKGLDKIKYLTSHSIWNLTELPKQFGIVGSGPIGCEMAQAFALLGAKVTVFDIAPEVLPRYSPTSFSFSFLHTAPSLSFLHIPTEKTPTPHE